MRVDKELLSVLMDDKRFKAKIEELQKEQKRLADVAGTVKTLEAAQALEKAAAEKKAKVDAYEKELSEMFERKVKELADQAKAQALALSERAAKEREQFRVTREVLLEIAEKQGEVALREKALAQKAAAVELQDRLVTERYVTLDKKIKRINEAFNGADIS